jgi:threonine/homoserine/homoserine lactone efflux protein
MGLFNPGSGTGGPRARKQRLEMLLGIIGFFVFMATIQTVVLEVRGEDALFSAMLLAGLCVLLWLVWRARRNTGV